MQESEPTRSPERGAQANRTRHSDSKLGATFPGASLLVAKSAGEVLERLLDGDPLELGPRLAQREIEQAVLIDPQRLIEIALARVAHDAMSYAGEPALGEWLDGCIDKAVETFLQREAEDDADGLPLADPEDPFYNLFAELFGVELPMARTISLHYHALPVESRRTFQAIFVDQKSIHRWVAEGHGPHEHVAAQLRYALEVMSSLGKTDLRDPDLDEGGESPDG